MFFNPRIDRKKHKRILEIGPGGLPHPASDAWLDYDFDEAERVRQSGGAQPARGKSCVFYRGKIFPFRDGAFDYVIASHVLEHVPWEVLPAFLSEMQRVAPAGYIELPRWTYELFFDIDEHISCGDVAQEKLTLYKKTERSPGAARRRAVLEGWLPLQEFLADRREFFFCRLEWREQIDFEMRDDEYPAIETEAEIAERLRTRPLALVKSAPRRSISGSVLNRIKRILSPRPGVSLEELRPLLQCPETGGPLDSEYRNEEGKVVFSVIGQDLKVV
ncbi:MAG: class I SAM-dependent methyltransferase [Leptospirales bacterium]